MIIGNDKFNQIYDNKPEIDNKKEKRFYSKLWVLNNILAVACKIKV